MTEKPYPQLQTPRLLLRKFKMTDGERVEALAGAYDVAEMTLNIPHPYEPGMAQEWFNTHQADFESDTAVVFAIASRLTEELMGACGLSMDLSSKRAELGYWIGKPYWSKGYCTEAASELMRYGFDHLGLNRIHASHMTHNPASGRVMKKLGMTQEGVLRQHALKWDRFVDLAVYGILADEWLLRSKQ